LLNRKLVVVQPDTPAIDAFMKLHTRGLTSLVICDPQHRYQCCGTLSASDVKALIDLPLNTLLRPLQSFFTLLSERKPLVTVPEKTPLRIIIKKLCINWAHRVVVRGVERGKVVSRADDRCNRFSTTIECRWALSRSPTCSPLSRTVQVDTVRAAVIVAGADRRSRRCRADTG
jgi:hypothetical protein